MLLKWKDFSSTFVYPYVMDRSKLSDFLFDISDTDVFKLPV